MSYVYMYSKSCTYIHMDLDSFLEDIDNRE